MMHGAATHFGLCTEIASASSQLQTYAVELTFVLATIWLANEIKHEQECFVFMATLSAEVRRCHGIETRLHCIAVQWGLTRCADPGRLGCCSYSQGSAQQQHQFAQRKLHRLLGSLSESLRLQRLFRCSD